MHENKLQPGTPAGIHEVYLQPGEYFWGDATHRLKTLLGSCVAICVWHPLRHIGGMSHCLLPSRSLAEHPMPAVTELSGRYIDETFEIFFEQMRKAGTERHEYLLKVFGGGNMFDLNDKNAATVGERNLQMMRQIVAREKIRIAAEHVGGKGHRNVIFELWSGDCWVKHAELL